jgi:hypothetical protein
MKTLLLSTLICIFVSAPVLAANPCKPIAKACEKAGYYQGGNSVGKGLVMNCILPVTAKKMSLENTNFSDETLSTCRTLIMKKMQ